MKRHRNLIDYPLNGDTSPPLHWITEFDAKSFRLRQQLRKQQQVRERLRIAYNARRRP